MVSRGLVVVILALTIPAGLPAQNPVGALDPDGGGGVPPPRWLASREFRVVPPARAGAVAPPADRASTYFRRRDAERA